MKLQELDKLDKEDWFITVCKLSTGQSFGELALLSNEARAATVTCASTCFFATLCKSDYMQILSKIELKQQQKKIDFLLQQPFFKFYTSHQVKKIVHCFSIENYTINQTIYQQGNQPQYLYIVLSGDFDIVRRFKKKKVEESNDETSRALLGPALFMKK